MRTPEHIIIPGSPLGLLRRELHLAFSRLGLRVSLADPAQFSGPAFTLHLSRLLDGKAALFLSINFHGLENMRRTLETLAAANCSVAVWCVDNPWNLLAGVRDPRWKSLLLLVTDESFAAPLRAHGADKVQHLPLATSPELFAPNEARDAAFPPPGDLAPFVFAGRSAFPGKDSFFRGVSPPPELLEKSLRMLRAGERPDLLWWERACKAQGPFWPGRNARLPALGAEESNLSWRALCLEEAARAGLETTGAAGAAGEACGAQKRGLDIIGDPGWLPFLPAGARLMPPVDYYAHLPGIYARARFSLSLTSLQLPRGLNQRHFDVWAAGGLCLCDASPGLDLFPEDLVRPIRFRNPGELCEKALALESGECRKRLISDWRSVILSDHTYMHRAVTLLELAGC